MSYFASRFKSAKNTKEKINKNGRTTVADDVIKRGAPGGCGVTIMTTTAIIDNSGSTEDPAFSKNQNVDPTVL